MILNYESISDWIRIFCVCLAALQREKEETERVYKNFLKEFGSDEEEDGAPAGDFGVKPHQGGSAIPGEAKKPPPSSKRHFLPSVGKTTSQDAALKDPSKHGASSTTSDPCRQESASAETEKFKSRHSQPAKVRNIDMLLENLKRDQAEREKRKEQGLDHIPTSAAEEEFDPTGALSTNLFVGNLAPEIDEHALVREFGRFGPIGSVKVMWPRDEEQRLRGRNTGFVAFMNRKDAEKARDALDGVALCGFILQVGWGKPVPLPSVPVWPPAGAGEGLSGAAAGALPNPESTRERKQDGPPPKVTVLGRGRDIDVEIPENPRIRFVIDAMSFYVSKDGCEFEQAIMSRERDNPEFAFLFDVDCSEHAYYRWRVFSLSSGDTLRNWRIDPFLMVEDSNRWLPPPMTLAATAANKAATALLEDAPLPAIMREKFNELLSDLTVERRCISDAMVFALDNADHAGEIASMVLSGIADAGIPGPRKVARLFLVSDILHNCSAQVRNASKYRSKIQDGLPDAFEGLCETYRSLEGRIAQEKLRKYVLSVLKVWRVWYVFSDQYIDGLQATFLRSATTLDGRPMVGTESDIHPALVAGFAALTDEELELRCKHNGLSRKGGRQVQVARLIALETYLKGRDGNKKNATAKDDEKGRTDSIEPKSAQGHGSGWVEVSAPKSEERSTRGASDTTDGMDKAISHASKKLKT